MKINFARLIDRMIGIPLCFLLGLYKKIFPFPAPQDKSPARILVIKFFGLGSITSVSTILNSITTHFPRAEVYFCTFHNNSQLFNYLEFKSTPRLITVRNDSFWHFFCDTLKVIRNVQRHKFDVVIDYEVFSAYTELLGALSNAPIRIGFYLPDFWRRALYSHFLFYHNTKHILQVYLDALKYLGINEPSIKRPEVKSINEICVSLEKKLPELDLNRTVGVNIHSSELTYLRRWPLNYFKQIVEQLIKAGYNVILTGSSTEVEYTNLLLQELPSSVLKKVHNFCGKLSLGEFLILLKKLPLFITNDSGPFHLAMAAGCKTISFWGPQTPFRYGPFFDREKHVVLYTSWPCSPCIHLPRTKAGTFCNSTAPCLRSITPDLVWNKIKDVLQL